MSKSIHIVSIDNNKRDRLIRLYVLALIELVREQQRQEEPAARGTRRPVDE